MKVVQSITFQYVLLLNNLVVTPEAAQFDRCGKFWTKGMGKVAFSIHGYFMWLVLMTSSSTACLMSMIYNEMTGGPHFCLQFSCKIPILETMKPIVMLSITLSWIVGKHVCCEAPPFSSQFSWSSCINCDGIVTNSLTPTLWCMWQHPSVRANMVQAITSS